MHSDPSVIDPRYRDDFLRRGSNYVEVTGTYNKVNDPAINIENQYNFGVQTPGGGAGTPGGVYDMPLEQKPVRRAPRAARTSRRCAHLARARVRSSPSSLTLPCDAAAR